MSRAFLYFVLTGITLMPSREVFSKDVNQAVYNIVEYGAVSDTSVNSAQSIQSAINEAYQNGGGVVSVPKGSYLSGTIVLKSNVMLQMEEGATLYASRKIEDYLMPLEDAMRPVLIYANGASNTGIKGKGIIHGNARHTFESLREPDEFIDDYTKNARNAGVPMERYYIVPPDVSVAIFTQCENLLFEDVTLTESSYWTLHVIRSKRVLMQRLTVRSSLEYGVNADGIDINSSSDVTVTNCDVETGDDGIVLKAWYEVPCENIRVSNCKVSSSSTALKIGTESIGDFRNITFENCSVINSNRGLSVVIREGGNAENITFSNIQIDCRRRPFFWWGNGDPIWVYVTKKRSHNEVGSINGIRFQNISAVGMGTSKIESDFGGAIKDVQMQNVRIQMIAEDQPDKRADHAMVLRNVSGASLQNLHLSWNKKTTESGWNRALFIESSHDISIENLFAERAPKTTGAPIGLKNAQHIELSNPSPIDSRTPFISVEGEESEDITVRLGQKLKSAGELLKLGTDVKQNIKIEIVHP